MADKVLANASCRYDTGLGEIYGAGLQDEIVVSHLLSAHCM